MKLYQAKVKELSDNKGKAEGKQAITTYSPITMQTRKGTAIDHVPRRKVS